MIFLLDNELKNASMSNDSESPVYPLTNLFNNYPSQQGYFDDYLIIDFGENKNIDSIAFFNSTVDSIKVEASDSSDFSIISFSETIEKNDNLNGGVFLSSDPIYAQAEPLNDELGNFLEDEKGEALLDEGVGSYPGYYSFRYWRVSAENAYIGFMFFGLKTQFPNPVIGSYPEESLTDIVNSTSYGVLTTHKGTEIKDQEFTFLSKEKETFDNLKNVYKEQRENVGLLLQTEKAIDYNPFYMALWSALDITNRRRMKYGRYDFTCNFTEQK